MSRALLLGILFSVILVACAEDNHASRWVTIPLNVYSPSAVMAPIQTLLDAGIDVRSHFTSILGGPQFALAVAPVSQLASLSALGFSPARVLASVVPEEQTFLYQVNGNTAVLTPEEMKLLAQTLLDNNVRIIGTIDGSVLAGGMPENICDLMPHVSARPISTTTFVVTPDYADSTAGRISKAYSQNIADLVAKVDRTRLSDTVQHLSSYFSRLAYTSSPTTLEAQKWIEKTLQDLGLHVVSTPFKTGYTNNVCGYLNGTVAAKKVVVIGAHYDSRARSMQPNVRAPGADDNASGTSAVLEIARVLKESKYSFQHSIQFCLWSGEEQGLYGSTAHAKALRSANVDVIAYLNADMISHKLSTEPVQLGMDNEYTSKSLTEDMKKIAAQYVPTLEVGTATGCCTDTVGFYNAGYHTASYFERRGGLRNPYYHTSDDDFPKSSNDFEQVQKITQSFLAGTATLAVPV